MRGRHRTVLLAIAVILFAFPSLADALRSDVIAHLDDAEKKLTALAEATPQESMTWRPGEGVRSNAEVFLHVAAGNYFLGGTIGAKRPEGLDLGKLDKSSTDKATILQEIKRSFEFARGAIEGAPGDLDAEQDLFGRQVSKRYVVLLIGVHAHEHLGQAIAYARMNGIAPPWSE
ncbi:MAG TPA: DinB family protein [Thermoanaerobaculia bacterium]|nr:DinB family protein [Thermoanaerobaculia bacterium]